MYTNVGVNISDKQKEQLRKALAAGEHLSLHLSHADLVGNDIIGVTQSQLSRRKKALETGKGVIIKMSKTQVARNMKIEGAFFHYWQALLLEPFRLLLKQFYLH